MPGIMNMPDSGNSELNTNRCFFMPMPINVILPAGVIMPYAGNITPNYWLLCDGSAVSRTEYKELFAAIGTTYGEGDGSTTFNLPNLVDKFIEGGNTSGTTKEAGLPNITGSFMPGATTQNATVAQGYPNGAFVYKTGGMKKSHNYNSTEIDWTPVAFDASRSSAVYGKSNTVQPASIVMKYIIKT